MASRRCADETPPAQLMISGICPPWSLHQPSCGPMHASASHRSFLPPLAPPATGSTSPGLTAGGPSSDGPSSGKHFQRRQSHQEASTSGRHALPSRRDRARCAASRASAPQRAVAQTYTSFLRKMRNRPATDKPTGVGSDDGSNEINPCALRLSGGSDQRSTAHCCAATAVGCWPAVTSSTAAAAAAAAAAGTGGGGGKCQTVPASGNGVSQHRM